MRRVININNNWSFHYFDKVLEINLPHTWNGFDGQDGGGDYVRGSFLYVRNLEQIDLKNDELLFLEFNGVNSSCEVFLNDVSIGKHDGGYSRFRFEITNNYLKESNNILKVLVDNSENDRVYPQLADFTFYGGIYRDVNLIIVNKTHFDLSYYGSNGIKVDTNLVDNIWHLKVEPWGNSVSSFDIELFDKEGKLVYQGSSTNDASLKDIHEWDGISDPYLYLLKASIKENGFLLDEVEEYIGFRKIEINSQDGFILNSKNYSLRGVARHQDRPNVGNAISYENMVEDAELIKEIGANTVRLAHYQHDEKFYSLCDKYGFIVWSEIPYISKHLKNADENAINQMKELIVQTYNHPSIICRGLSNEITMKGGKGLKELHRKLYDLVNEMDKNRFSAIANYATVTSFSKLSKMADATAMNFYHGWYTPFIPLAGIRLSIYHLINKKMPLGFSEYGAEGMPNLHSKNPRRGDNSEEYQLICHYKTYNLLEKRKYLWCTYVWNMFDFAADARNVGGEPGKNHKGLVTFDRKIKKDAFYVYKAFWSNEKFIHICGKRYVDRVRKNETFYVASNVDSFDVYLNDKKVRTMLVKEKLIKIKIHLEEGKNKLKVISNNLVDEGIFNKVNKENKDYKLHVKSENQTWQKK